MTIHSHKKLILSSLGVVILASTGMVAAAVTRPAATKSVPTASTQIAFSAPAFLTGEAGPASVDVVLSRPSPTGVTFTVHVTAGTASTTAGAFPADVGAVDIAVNVAAGARRVVVPLPVTNDTLAEPDETVTLTLTKVTNAALAAGRQSATLTIVDDDRKALADVRAAGAKGDGVTDDTTAIQRAVDTVAKAGGGVVVFPAGTYVVRSVSIKAGITYQGYDGATILRPPNQDKWTRTFTTENAPYEGDVDSAPLVVRGLIFDGNSAAQGAYKGYEKEQAHLLFLNASPKRAGRLVSVVEGVTFRNGVADGLGAYINTDTRAVNVRGENVFRGAVVLTGGNSKLSVDGLVTVGNNDVTGVDVEVDGSGFGNTKKVWVTMANMDLDADFDVAVADGSEVVIHDVVSRRPPFYLSNYASTTTITNASFAVGGADQYANRIVYAGNLTFDRVKFVVAADTAKNPRAEFYGLDLWWSHPSGPKAGPQVVDLINSTFVVEGQPSPLRGILNRYRVQDRDTLTTTGTTFAAAFGPNPISDAGT